MNMEELKNKAHYVSVTGIVVKEVDGENKYLICKRSEKEKIFPGKWCVPGGKIEQKDYINLTKDTTSHWLDIFEKTLEKEVLEEVGIKIKKPAGYVSNLALLRPNGFSTLIMSMYAYYESGEVNLNKDELSDFAWVNVKEAKSYDLIENIYEQIQKVDEMLK